MPCRTPANGITLRTGEVEVWGRAAREPLYSIADPVHLLLALDMETIRRHIADVVPGGAVVYESKDALPDALRRDDVLFIPAALADLARDIGGMELMRNTLALGIAAGVLEFDLSYVESIIRDNFARKGEDVVTSNLDVIQAGVELAKEYQADLTKGQFSPTSEKGWKTSTSPEGSAEAPVQPLALALTHGATFVGRGYPGEIKHLIWLIGEAMEHPGYALVDVLQPCVTFNKPRAYDYYSERVYKLDDEPDYDPGNRTAAWERAQEWGDRIPIGIFYRATLGPTFEALDPVLQEGPPLVKRPLEKLAAAQVESLLAGLR